MPANLSYFTPRVLTGVINLRPLKHDLFASFFKPRTPQNVDVLEVQTKLRGVAILPAITNYGEGTMRDGATLSVAHVKAPCRSPGACAHPGNHGGPTGRRIATPIGQAAMDGGPPRRRLSARPRALQPSTAMGNPKARSKELLLLSVRLKDSPTATAQRERSNFRTNCKREPMSHRTCDRASFQGGQVT